MGKGRGDDDDEVEVEGVDDAFEDAHQSDDEEYDANAIEVFTVIKGELFVVDADGAVARRCVPGDVVFLPEGWRGSLRGGDARAEAAAVSVAGPVATGPATSIGSNVTTASSPASSRGAERDEMYDPENETRGRR